MKRAKPRAKTRRRAGGTARKARRRDTRRRAAKRAIHRKSGAARTLVAEAAIASATARAQASVRAELRNKTHVAEKLTEAAINEAEEIGLLLEDGDEDDDEPPSDSMGEDDYFVKTRLGPPHPRVRPAPGIEKGVQPPLLTARAKRAARAAARAARRGGRPAPVPDAAAKQARPAGTARAPRRDAGPLVVGDAGASSEAAHLFPRNLTLAYPVAVRGEGVSIEDRDGRRYLDGCSGAVVCSIGHGVRE